MGPDYRARFKGQAIQDCVQNAVQLGYASAGADASTVVLTHAESEQLIHSLTQDTPIHVS
jgi:hypothetical protein